MAHEHAARGRPIAATEPSRWAPRSHARHPPVSRALQMPNRARVPESFTSRRIPIVSVRPGWLSRTHHDLVLRAWRRGCRRSSNTASCSTTMFSFRMRSNGSPRAEIAVSAWQPQGTLWGTSVWGRNQDDFNTGASASVGTPGWQRGHRTWRLPASGAIRYPWPASHAKKIIGSNRCAGARRTDLTPQRETRPARARRASPRPSLAQRGQRALDYQRELFQRERFGPGES